MTREEAIRLMAVYEAMGACLGPVFRPPKSSEDTEGERLALAHGRIIMTIYEEGMRPIIAKFPDLDPDLERAS